MTLSEISIRNPVFAWMLMIALMFFGWIGFSRMGTSMLPDVDFPVVNIMMTYEGAAPEVIETEVIDVMEDTVLSIDGIRNITSSGRQGVANISIEFELDKDVDVAVQEVQSRITQAQGRLPRDVDPAIITKVNPEDHPIMWVGFTGDGKTTRQLIDYAEDRIKPLIQTVSGVGDVILGGFLERNLRVWVDGKKLAAHEVTMEDVISTIQLQHGEQPAGRIETAEKEFNIRVMGEAPTPADFENLIVSQRGGLPIYRPFRLKDVASIEDNLSDVRRVARVDGKPAIGLGIRKQRGSNSVAVGDGIKKRIEEMNKTLPAGFYLNINYDGTKFIRDSVHELNFTLILSALLTSLVCWLFLGSITSTINVLLAIPTSILGTFIVLYFFGFTLNYFTLLGLSLAIGIVVDDAIMVLENITRHNEMGKHRVQAAKDGAREITFSAMASTMAIVAIFLPVAFMAGPIGKYFFQFGVTMAAAVMLSLLEALTLTPMRCSQFLTIHHTGRVTRMADATFKRLNAFYRGVLSISLRWRWGVIVASLAIFAGSLVSIKAIRKETSPPQDQSMFFAQVRAPIGSSIDYTDKNYHQIEAWLQSRPEIQHYFAAIGGFGGGEVDTGVLFVTMVPPKERKLTQQEFLDVARKELNEKVKGLRAILQDLSLSGFTSERGFPIEFSIRGPEWEPLGEAAKKIEDKMKASGLYQDIDDDYRIGMPEIRIFPDRPKASERGVSVASIAQTINAAFGGVRAGKFTKGGRRYDVRVRLEAKDRISREDVNSLFVRNNRGELIPLSEVVTIVERPTVQVIQRRNRERSIGIFSNLTKGVSQADAIAKSEAIAKEALPEGYRVELTGGSRALGESFAGLRFAFIVGIIVAYMVLGSQFNSFLHPFTVLLALPFSITGGLLALLVTNQSLNIYSGIGLVLLTGIVKKNSILLVDFTNQARARGKPVREALLEACPTRLRAILMTSFATVAAAIPPALAIGPGAETRIPMAIAVIGGVLVSTLLTLLVVPCAYEVLSPLERNKPRALTENDALVA